MLPSMLCNKINLHFFFISRASKPCSDPLLELISEIIQYPSCIVISTYGCVHCIVCIFTELHDFSHRFFLLVAFVWKTRLILCPAFTTC
uniref:Uncharacterized protein n=1 Tax=Arundo donax TaxID=35708 RepID=A0A0A9HM29_ARUDO